MASIFMKRTCSIRAELMERKELHRSFVSLRMANQALKRRTTSHPSARVKTCHFLLYRAHSPAQPGPDRRPGGTDRDFALVPVGRAAAYLLRLSIRRSAPEPLSPVPGGSRDSFPSRAGFQLSSISATILRS